MFPVIAAMEFDKLQKAKPSLPPFMDVDPDNYTPCHTSASLLAKYHPVVLKDYIPISVCGDGNCLFRSVSFALYGSQDHHTELRARVALEVATQRSWYDKDHVDYCAPFKDEPFIVCPSYSDLCRSVPESGKYADVMSILALSCVTGCRIQMFFPRLTSAFDAHPLTRCVVGRGVDMRARCITIMWTTLANPATVPVEINHFVPLMNRSTNAVVAEPIVVDDGPEDDADDDDQDDDVHYAAEEYDGDQGDDADHDDDGDDAAEESDVDQSDDAATPQHAADETDDDEEPAVKRSRFEPDGNGNSVASNEDVSNAAFVTSKPKCSNALDRFHSSQETYQLLRSATPDDVLPDVPRGRKDNSWYLVDNSQNAQRKQGNQKNRFWDDCGVWDTKKCRNLTSTFVRSATGESGCTLQCVEEREGKYCIKRRVNKKVTWEPLNPQPAQVSVIVMCSYYATLKSPASFRKRATWLRDSPQVALIEYIGTAPEVKMTHGHSRQTDDPEFVRTHPRVMDKMRVALEHREKPNQVYEQHVLAGNSFDLPRDVKQVRNLGQAVRSNEPGKAFSNGIKNIADDMLAIINGVQDNAFIQSVVLSKGKSPIVIAYLPQQISDMHRFCNKDTPEYLRSVIGVDRTFNLGPCFVTTLVYKNMSVVRKSSNDSPIFLGPVMFHFDAKTETYTAFFSHLAGVLGVEGVTTELMADDNMIFGSDEERAIVNAIRAVFHRSGIQYTNSDWHRGQQ